MIYTISTYLVAAMLTVSACSYLWHEPSIQGVRDLGFPDFFRIELAVLMLIATFVLLFPQVPVQMKEWAYAGVALFFVTAIIGHHVHHDPIAFNLINVVFLGVLVVSNLYMPR